MLKESQFKIYPMPTQETFKVAHVHGRDNMGSDTFEVLLYGQLQEGLYICNEIINL